MTAIVLDTETNTLHGVPLQIAYLSCSFEHGRLEYNKDAIFDELFSIDEHHIDIEAMAVHHIIEADLVGKPSYKTFTLPANVEYIIGHNIEYDLGALALCDIDTTKYKPICTLALARRVFPECSKHSLGVLSYYLAKDKAQVREYLKNAHDAKVDILLTIGLLKYIVKKENIQTMEDLYQLSQAGPTFMPFGKHKGTALVNLPDSYVSWLLNQENIDPKLRNALINRKG